MESRNAFVLSASGIVLNRGIAVQKSTLRCALAAAERSATCSSSRLLHASRVFVAGNTSSFYGPRASPRNTISAQRVQFKSQTVSQLSQDELKKLAAEKAVDAYFKSGMVVGLGTGSTAAFAVDHVGKKLKDGSLKDIVAIPTSKRTAEQAESLGIPLGTLDLYPKIDVTIDGADEVDPELNLVKGRGGALLREKMVELASDKFVVIVDDTKLVKGLGITGAMPVEVTQFCFDYNRQRLVDLFSTRAELRNDGNTERYAPYVTDNGNYIVDLYFKEPMSDPYKAAEVINSFVGVVEHGLFLKMAYSVIVAKSDGIVELMHTDPNDYSTPVISKAI